MAANDSLKYAAGPRATAQAAHDRGRIAATVRYDLADSPVPGDDYLHLLTPGGDEFAVGTVESVIDTTVDRVLYYVHRDSVLYGHDSTAELASALDGYYEDPIGAMSPVTLIYYDVTDWEVGCTYCGDPLATLDGASDHHADEHPGERWAPYFYPEYTPDREGDDAS